MDADRADSLLTDYRPGDFLLAAPDHTLLATGARHVVTETDPDELAARVTKSLLDTDTPVAVGALPFDPSAEPRIVVPEAVRRAGAVRRDPPPAPPDPGAPTVTHLPDPDGYRRAVAAAVTALRNRDDLRKVVLARTMRLAFADPVAVGPFLPRLASANPLGYTFAADLAAGGTLLGASPELLLSRRGTAVESNPLAGSAPRSADPAIDRANAAALLASAKDLAEHRVVVEAVRDALRPFCRDLRVPDRPSLVATPSVWHLSTRVTGELADPDVSSLRLATALHPTPAICGSPVERARQTIAELEPFPRDFYSGLVGWCDAHGDGQWVIALRCARVEDRSMLLYAGAGIMPDSDPALELAETTAKFRTMLGALGVDAG